MASGDVERLAREAARSLDGPEGGGYAAPRRRPSSEPRPSPDAARASLRRSDLLRADKPLCRPPPIELIAIAGAAYRSDTTLVDVRRRWP